MSHFSSPVEKIPRYVNFFTVFMLTSTNQNSHLKPFLFIMTTYDLFLRFMLCSCSRFLLLDCLEVPVDFSESAINTVSPAYLIALRSRPVI